jgi:hypothetical protein
MEDTTGPRGSGASRASPERSAAAAPGPLHRKNAGAFRDAPPTRNPSTSGAASSPAFWIDAPAIGNRRRGILEPPQPGAPPDPTVPPPPAPGRDDARIDGPPAHRRRGRRSRGLPSSARASCLENILGFATLALRQGLADAEHRCEAGPPSRAHLGARDRVVLAEETPPLRVPYQDVLRARVAHLLGRNLTGKCTARLRVAVLRAESRPTEPGLERAAPAP